MMAKKRFGSERYLYPMPAVLVGAMVEGKPNYMTAAWCGMTNSNPPILSVSLQAVRYTRIGIEAEGAFSINVPSTAQAAETDFAGIYTGRKTDKSKLFTTFFGELPNVPLIEECPVNLECEVVERVDLPSHRVFFGRIVECHVSEECLEDGVPKATKIDPLIWSPSDNHYFGIGAPIAPAFKVGKTFKV